MLLHNHDVENGETGVVEQFHVMHLSPEEAKQLIKSLTDAILEYPESESFGLTLGRIDSVVNHVEEAAADPLVGHVHGPECDIPPVPIITIENGELG